MPEHLRALVVILVIACLTFWLAKGPVCAIGLAEEDFVRRRNAWFGITLAAFLAHNFWLFMFLAGVIVWRANQREKNPLALYFALLFAAPSFGGEISGFGVINHLFTINHLRLLSLVLLLPAWWQLRADPSTPHFGVALADKLLLGYLVLQFGLQLSADTFTNSLRYSFYFFVDIFLPYYVASRSLRQREQFRDAIACFVLAALVMSPLAVFEFVHHWLLYSTLDDVLGVPWGFSGYLARGDTLRALVTTGQPIALGYAMTVALSLAYVLWPRIPAWWRMPVLLALVVGLIAPVSRGPWVGAAVAAVFIALSGEDMRRQLFRIAGLGSLTVMAVLASPYGDTLIDYLPFVGNVEVENITYRQVLLDNSIETIKQNPFFGAFDFIYNPLMEEMRQGQGIIDLVNSFLAVGLSSGLVGLSLFAGVFVVVLFQVLGRALATRRTDAESHRLGVGLAATQVGILVTIFTVSSITIIPVIYWSIFGMGLAYIFAAATIPAPSVEASSSPTARPVRTVISVPPQP